MLYSKAKILTEEEYKALRDADAKRFNAGYKNYTPYRKNYRSIDRKKIQRCLNSHVKRCNKNIKDDFLWRERFFIRQVEYASFNKFEDNSGGELFVTLRFYDKKTMKYIDTVGYASNLCFGHGSVYYLMNKVITEKFDTWKDNDPYEDRIDYRSIPNDWVVKNAEPLNKEYNYFNI